MSFPEPKRRAALRAELADRQRERNAQRPDPSFDRWLLEQIPNVAIGLALSLWDRVRGR